MKRHLPGTIILTGVLALSAASAGLYMDQNSKLQAASEDRVTPQLDWNREHIPDNGFLRDPVFASDGWLAYYEAARDGWVEQSSRTLDEQKASADGIWVGSMRDKAFTAIAEAEDKISEERGLSPAAFAAMDAVSTACSSPDPAAHANDWTAVDDGDVAKSHLPDGMEPAEADGIVDSVFPDIVRAGVMYTCG